MIALLIFTAFQAAAMPPHPGNLNPSGRERPPAPLDRQTPLYQSLMRSSEVSRISASSPATGTVKVLVILADFGAEVATAPPVVFTDKNSTDFGGKSGFPAFISLSALFFLFTLKKWKWILPLSAYFIVLSSCPSSGGRIDYGDPLYFNTSKSVYEQILEKGTGLTMTKYYSDMSKDTLNLTFDVFGPYRVSKGWQYYGENDSNGFDMYPGKFVGEAVDLAEQDGVDFSDYTNVEGSLPTVIVVHAGQGEELTRVEESIWSHNWSLSEAEAYGDGSGARYYDGVSINNYTLQPEYSKTPGIPTIGVFCHEFGHVLGLPDLYDTTLETNGVGYWSLMGSGSWGSGYGEDPSPLLAWERDRIGGTGWVKISELTSNATNQNIENIEHTDREAFKITLGNSQYLLLEG
ncbi:MAG: M6 family metalloprotease domain-containing protein, partial [Spirochaetia bacterium]|nr:M6 family metalloprotease domain-containing protein [Spirochaetia bacterium]